MNRTATTEICCGGAVFFTLASETIPFTNDIGCSMGNIFSCRAASPVKAKASLDPYIEANGYDQRNAVRNGLHYHAAVEGKQPIRQEEKDRESNTAPKCEGRAHLALSVSFLSK
ncbi:MAG: hypothetical protein J6Q30_01275 [Oscillospiraceae bacterium]|nr:hypothetical protein [Oscillospiraceae bacterium]